MAKHSEPRSLVSSDRARRWRRRCLALAAAALCAAPGCVLHEVLRQPESVATQPGPDGKPPAAAANEPLPDPNELLAAKRDTAVTTAAQTPVAQPEPPVSPRAAAAATPPPTSPEIAALTPSIPMPVSTYPIDITTALRLAEVENPRIAEARAGVLEALAVQQGARALLLPTVNGGVTYHGHTGNLQRSSGRILSLSEQSLYVGGGARTLAAEAVNIPMLNIASPITDAIFEPLAARQRVDQSRLNASATANDVLLDVALMHQELLYAEASLEMRRLTEAQAVEVARLTAVYAQTQMGLRSDANRAATELKHRQFEVEHGEEEVAVASARLARRLHLDPSVQLRTLESSFEPLAIVDLSSNVEDLIRVALQQRPDLGASSAAVAVARTRFGQEKARPLLPTLWMGFSGGMFGGGSNLVPPFLGNFAGRTDFDVRAIWTLQNMGMGNISLIRQRQAQIGQAVGEQSRVLNQVRREVTAALAQARAGREQLEAAIRGLESSERGYREDFLRIQSRAENAYPIELLDSLDLLAEARLRKVQAILDYNQAQFRLFVSLGTPPPLGNPPAQPLPPPPVATPPLPPLYVPHGHGASLVASPPPTPPPAAAPHDAAAVPASLPAAPEAQ